MTSAFKRIASGSLAMWSRMAVTMLFQVALVPLYLSYWSAKTYGAWLALQAAYALATIFDTAHQSYLENEFLKSGRHDLGRLRRALYSAMPVDLLLSVVQIALLLVVYRVGAFSFMTGLGGIADRELRDQAFWVLLAWLVTWSFTLSVSGLVGRALSSLGYYSRFAWWGLLFVISSTLIPAFVLMHGGDLLHVGLAQAGVTMAYHVLWLSDAWRLLRKENVFPVLPSMDTALANLGGAAFVWLRQILDLSRQHGFRIVMAPLVGLQKLAEFSTQRTVANAALQGLNGIYAPLMPELMRYIRERDQGKVEGAFALLWGLLMVLLCPLVVGLQIVMPVLYPLWTRGKFRYDGLLLGIISSSILVYMIALPAMAVCIGNNLVKAQLGIAALAALVLFGTLPVFIHFWALRGAALSLLCAEATAAICYVRQARIWLVSAGLQWPRHGFGIVLCAVVNAVVGMTLIAWLPGASIALFAVFVGLSIPMLLRTWRSLPDANRLYVRGHILHGSQFIRHWFSRR
jgi:O-antigen/teichoic acid export membrane protein